MCRFCLCLLYDWEDVEEEARAAGITGFISKPLFKSTLYHYLKLFAEKEVQDVDLPAEPQIDFSGKRLLVAEDNELNWEIANELLSNVGFVLVGRKMEQSVWKNSLTRSRDTTM